MPDNISGIGKDYSTTNPALRTTLNETQEKAQSTTAALNSTARANDETGFVDVDFENMSLEEIQQTTIDLKIELLAIQTEMANLEELIKSDEKIREAYEKQYEALKKEFDELTDKAKDEEDPAQKARLQATASNIKSSINMLLTQINSTTELIKTHSNIQSSLQDDYSKTNMSYQSAVLEQNTKSREQATINTVPMQNTTGAAGISGTQNVPAAGQNTVSTSQKSTSTGHVSNTMLNALKNWEGLRTTAYKCPAGVWTIGYGHTGGVSAGQTISEAQAEQLLRQDLQSFENEVTNMANAKGVKLSQGQYDALVSFAYNCGGGALQKSGILDMLKSGNVSGAASKMNEYVHGGGQVLPGLVSRRKVESSWLYA